jgi:hypothetical protein
VSLRDGTIDLDMAVGTHRNFSAFYVRRERAGEYEEFYLRTHKSELPDAIQYVPAWQGVGGWQLFHGAGFTAKAVFPRDRWFPVRIVLSGDRAAGLRERRREAAARRAAAAPRGRARGVRDRLGHARGRRSRRARQLLERGRAAGRGAIRLLAGSPAART